MMITSLISNAQTTPVKNYLNLKVPVNINRTNFQLVWSAHPTKEYYKHEYLEKGDTLPNYRRMVLVEAIKDPNLTIEQVAGRKVEEIKRLKANNPIVNYNVFTKNGQMIIDFLLSENNPDGTIKIIERNVYKYGGFKDKFGKTGVQLFGVSDRAYGEDAERFLKELKENKDVLVEQVANYVIPEMAIRN